MKKVGLFVLGMLAAACGHTETYEAMFRVAEPPPSHPVELYMADQQLPQRVYYEIALVQAVGFGDEAHPEDVARALTVKASALGCDAVVRMYIDQGYSRSNANGVCVKWVGDAAPGTVAGQTTLPKAASPPPKGQQTTTPPPMEWAPTGTPGAGGR